MPETSMKGSSGKYGSNQHFPTWIPEFKESERSAGETLFGHCFIETVILQTLYGYGTRST